MAFSSSPFSRHNGLFSLSASFGLDPGSHIIEIYKPFFEKKTIPLKRLAKNTTYNHFHFSLTYALKIRELSYYKFFQNSL